MGILSSNHMIETVDVFFIMFAMWMVASGLIHLVSTYYFLKENSNLLQGYQTW